MSAAALHRPWALGDGAFYPGWLAVNATRGIFKCTRWQLEETGDFFSCPFHYYCDSSHPADYPAAVGFLVLLFAAYCFLSTAGFTVLDLAAVGTVSRKYLVPSGPFLLPLLLLTLAKGSRITAVFPVPVLGPALLLLLQSSALAFRNDADGDIRYAVLEASTVSGLLHASLYLDAVILPYYTGLEALHGGRLSGDCATCVCREEALLVTGRQVLYRGLSRTTLLIVFALCSRMVCRIYGAGAAGADERRPGTWVRAALETASWVMVAGDSVRLMARVMAEGSALGGAVYGGVCAVVVLCIFTRVYRFLAAVEARAGSFLLLKPNHGHHPLHNLCHNVV